MKRLRLLSSSHAAVLCVLSMMLSLIIAESLQSAPTFAASAALPTHVQAHATKPHVFKAHAIGRNSRTNSSDQLTYNGGPVMHSSVTYAIFWEPSTLQDGSNTQVSPTYNHLLQNYFGDIGGSGLYNVNTQYYDTNSHIANNSTFGGAWTDTSAYPDSQCNDSATLLNCITDTQIQAEVARAITVNNWTSGLTHMFYVFTSSGEGSCFDTGSSSCAFTDYCAYHSFFTANNNQPIIYANMPYTGTNLNACGVSTSPNHDFDADSTINVTSHEHMEAVTDPELNAWYDVQGNEIGDKCAWNFGTTSLDNGNANVQWNSHYYIVQQEWSNAIDGCTLSYATPQPSTGGTAYVGSNDGSVYAINTNDGTQRWQARTGGAVISSPFVVNNTVFVGSKDHYVYAFNSNNGSLLWRTRTQNAIYSSPQVVNGTLFVGSADGFFYALNSSNGSILWRFRARSAIFTTPAIANNIAYVSASNGWLYALNTNNGRSVWLAFLHAGTLTSPTVANSLVYIGTSSGLMLAFNASNGRAAWQFTTSSSVWQAPTVTNNTVSFGALNGFFYSLNAQKGYLLWRYHTRGSVSTSATIDNNVVYFGDYDHNLYALNATMGNLLWRYQTGGSILSTPVSAGGEIYFGSDDRNLYALSESNALLSWHYLTGEAVQSSPSVVLPPA